MMLGDAFNQRKRISAEIQSWVNRLIQAGKDVRQYRTLTLEGEKAFVPEPGSEKTSQRHYTVEECHQRIEELTKQDRELALRISLTNQQARAEVEDMDGTVREYTIPELLVLRNEIIPQMENVIRSTPTLADGVNVFDQGDGFVKHRSIRKIERKKQTLSDKGHKVEETAIEGYDVVETTDYGVPVREVWDKVDRIQEFAQRVKQAINQANKTELIELQ